MDPEAVDRKTDARSSEEPRYHYPPERSSVYPLLSVFILPLFVAWSVFSFVSPAVLFTLQELWLLVLTTLGIIAYGLMGPIDAVEETQAFPRKTVYGILLALAVLAVGIQYLSIGFGRSLVNFSYARWGFPPIDFTRLFSILGWMFLARFVGEERLFRGLLLKRLVVGYGWWKALALHLVLYNMVLMPYWMILHRDETAMGLWRAVVWENLIGIEAAAVFILSGSLFSAVMLHTGFDFFSMALLSDVESGHESLFTFASSSSSFYTWILVVHTMLALGLAVWAGRVKGRFIVKP